MQKTDKKHLKLLLCFCLISNIVFSQAKSGLENYNLLTNKQEYMWMPVGHYRTQKGLHAEVRYNYEEINTFSLYGGKNINGGKKMKYSVTPMLGISFGEFQGISIASNTDIEWNNWYLSSQTQYSFSTDVNNDNFFFSWSEAGVSITENVFVGLAIQYTGQKNESVTETGFVAGFDFKNISIPVYVFNTFSKNRSFILGLNYEFSFSKKGNKK